MVSPAFILCSIFLLSGAFVDAKLQQRFGIFDNVGSSISGAVSGGKGVIGSIGSTVGSGLDKAKNITTGSLNNAGSAIAGSISSGKDVIGNIGSTVSQGISSGIESAKDVASGNEILNGVGNTISGAISSGKDVVGNIGSSVTQGISSGIDNVKNVVENVKDISNVVINGLTPSQSQGIVATIKNIMRKVMQDIFMGKNFPTSLVDRTIEETSKMDSKFAYALRVTLMKVQELQRGEKIDVVAAKIAKSVFDKYSGKIKALDETLDILGRENVEHLIGKIAKKLQDVIEKRVLDDNNEKIVPSN